MDSSLSEIRSGKRFHFGKNWKNFSSTLSDERIKNAENSLKDLVGRTSLDGMRFLDIGSGSGLFSLAAFRLGAHVHSFDYDEQSVTCTRDLRSRYIGTNSKETWKVDQGSVLDQKFMKSLGEFDIVYSWGVLHHTGSMWEALGNATIPMKKNGVLIIAIYNDEGARSERWRKVKRCYCSSTIGKVCVCSLFIPYYSLRYGVKSLLYRKNFFRDYKNNHRGMSFLYDLFDWLGGYPFEVAKVEDIFHFYKERDLVLKTLTTDSGHGCNQFVFVGMGDS